MKDSLEVIQKIDFNPLERIMTITVKAPKAKAIKSIETLDGNALLESMKFQIKTLKKHFKEDGWNIDKGSVIKDVLHDVLGFHLDDVVGAYIAEKTGTQIEYKDGGSSFVKKDGYSPVFYDMYTGEIVVLDNPQDKSYIDEYSERNGYMYLGGL